MNGEGTLDDRYLEWLYKQTGQPLRNQNPARTYWKLLKKLYSHSFYWFVPNDDNRAMDGIDLRFEFFRDEHIEEVDHSWLMLECSMLEMFIALSRRVAYQSSNSPAEWFWKMMENLDLRQYTDLKYNEFVDMEVKETLERVNYRTYEPNGVGGVFPLVSSHRDQREIELWYQASAYLQEGSFVENGP